MSRVRMNVPIRPEEYQFAKSNKLKPSRILQRELRRLMMENK